MRGSRDLQQRALDYELQLPYMSRHSPTDSGYSALTILTRRSHATTSPTPMSAWAA
jgi:hypothetical protein